MLMVGAGRVVSPRVIREPECCLAPAGAVWAAFRSHPAAVKTWSPVDKGKHEANDFLQPEYIDFFFFFALLQSTFLKRE